MNILNRLLRDLTSVPFQFWIFLGFTVFAYGKKEWGSLRQKRLSEAAQSWPEQEARVVSAQSIVQNERGSHGAPKMIVGLLTYSYMAEEIEIGEYRVHFSMESEADAWARGLRGTRVRIRVNPDMKTESVWVDDQVETTIAKARQEAANDDVASAPLTGLMELGRLSTSMVAMVAGVVAVWVHFEVLYALFAGRAETATLHKGLFWSLHMLGITCALVSGALARSRFPGSAENAGYIHLSASAKRTVRIAAGYATFAFAAIWLWSVLYPARLDDPGMAGFTAAWIPEFLGSWLICQRLAAEDDLGAQLASRQAKL